MALSPLLRNLPTAQLFAHLQTLRAVFQHERYRNVAGLVALAEVHFELTDRARHVDVAATFDGMAFLVPFADEGWEGRIEVPPADFDGFCVLRTGSTPR